MDEGYRRRSAGGSCTPPGRNRSLKIDSTSGYDLSADMAFSQSGQALWNLLQQLAFFFPDNPALSSTIPGSLTPKHSLRPSSKPLRRSKGPPCPELDALELLWSRPCMQRWEQPRYRLLPGQARCLAMLTYAGFLTNTG